MPVFSFTPVSVGRSMRDGAVPLLILAPLFRLEVRHLVRQKLGWAILALLFGAIVIACAAGASRVRAEKATLERVVVEEQRPIERAKAVNL